MSTSTQKKQLPVKDIFIKMVNTELGHEVKNNLQETFKKLLLI